MNTYTFLEKKKLKVRTLLDDADINGRINKK
jgi:hypothetical protein